MDSKDAQESLENGGGGARCRCSNGRRTKAAVLLIQSLLTAAFVAFSLSILLNQQHQQPSQPIWDNGIYLQLLNLDEMRFTAIWNQKVKLNNERTLNLSCDGPYMVYLWACAEKHSTEAAANLTLEQGNTSFHLQTLQNGKCQQMQSVFMLSTKSEVKLKVERIKDTKIDQLFLGLHYMLGAQCFQVSLPDDR